MSHPELRDIFGFDIEEERIATITGAQIPMTSQKAEQSLDVGRVVINDLDRRMFSELGTMPPQKNLIPTDDLGSFCSILPRTRNVEFLFD